MNSYYYTFDSDPGFPYQNGWVEVRAVSREETDRKFRARFPDRPGNEERWKQMAPEHTWRGWKLHEIIE